MTNSHQITNTIIIKFTSVLKSLTRTHGSFLLTTLEWNYIRIDDWIRHKHCYIVNNQRMKLSMVSRIIKVQVYVICWSPRLRCITETEAMIIVATTRESNKFLYCMVAIDKPGGKRNLVKNINAQHKVLKRPVITETLIKTEINFTVFINVSVIMGLFKTICWALIFWTKFFYYKNFCQVSIKMLHNG